MDVSILGGPAASTVQSSPGASKTPQLAPTPAPVSTPAPIPVSAAGSPHVSAPAPAPAAPTPTLAQVKQAVDNINASLNANGNSQAVQFAVDPSSKRVVVQVIDPVNGKVIRQIPSEEIIQMSMVLGQKLGKVINQEA
ncbi:flagellar protein FlaG [Solimicrobium silvestre]|uniref:FlaG protein n=1 Tax=Solimicrobium silvestre TaxID=2099400 RepID=A0A2S9GUW3_9BURK|nr:flagellar protein FlaG [Solimicrobium silvestre]PRC91488.1 FlaG protein [Solimicrobium silvestre]